MFTGDWLLDRITFWIPLLLSLTVHEGPTRGALTDLAMSPPSDKAG
jgi:hypothetical protein